MSICEVDLSMAAPNRLPPLWKVLWDIALRLYFLPGKRGWYYLGGCVALVISVLRE